jgi:hypothetical protein
VDKPHLASDEMKPFLKGIHHISAKQVPSALTLRHAGSHSVEKSTDILLEAGFRIEEFSGTERKTLVPEVEENFEEPSEYSTVADLIDMESVISSLSSLTAKDKEATEGFTKVNTPRAGHLPKGFHRRIAYEDFFAVVAGRFLADTNDLPDRPRVLVWEGDVKRLQDPISPNFFQWEKFGLGRPRNRVRFQDVSSPEVQMDFLMRHTHWGYKLAQLCKEEASFKEGAQLPKQFKGKAPTTARLLRKTLLHFLKGMPDPRWTKDFASSIYEDEEPRKHYSRATRLLEVLKTVDGITVQRMCCYPHEKWSYEKYDILVLNLIWEIISDEFIDGQLRENAFSIRTRYSELKTARKLIKYCTLNKDVDLENHPHFQKNAKWLRFFLPLYREMENTEDRTRKLYLAGTRAQTRGAGKPPLLENLRSKIKFLKTVSIPDTLSDTALMIVRMSMAKELEKLPDHIFTGLRTKARVTVNANSSWEKTQAEAGTLAAVQEFCQSRALGDKAMIYDLDTGKPERYLEDSATAGEYIFWRALEEVLWLTTEQRRDAMLVVVDEPGKSRSITKTRACIKIVLDLVNKICAIPLEKGFDSSQSGMRAAHHAWNQFKSFETKDYDDILFSVETTSRQDFADFAMIRKIYKRVFVTSTDYETATDFLSHKVAREIGVQWMSKCGIPRVLQGLVCEIAYGPRNIHFYGNMEIGVSVDSEKNLRKIQTQRGVLMGDPLTKIVLHFVNIVARSIALNIANSDLLSRVFGPEESPGTKALMLKILDF